MIGVAGQRLSLVHAKVVIEGQKRIESYLSQANERRDFPRSENLLCKRVPR